MEDVWKDLSLTTPSLPLLQLQPTTNSNGYTTTDPAFSLTYQDFFGAPHTNSTSSLSSDNSELKFTLEGQLEVGITSAASSTATEDSGNRQKSRIMKNRESAARSRARKQAYTKELQIAIDGLRKENSKLKKQCDELARVIAENRFAPHKHTQAPPATRKGALQRTSSAPC